MYLLCYRTIPSCMLLISNPLRQGHSSLVFDSENVSLRDLFRPLYLVLIETKPFLSPGNDLTRPWSTLVYDSWGPETSNEGQKRTYTTSRSQPILLSRLRFSICFNLPRTLFSMIPFSPGSKCSRCKIFIIPDPHGQKSPLHSATALTQPNQATNHLPPSLPPLLYL